MLLGEFEHTIDDKGRITVPAKFRGRLAAGLVVTKGIDSCLWLYPTDVWAELAEEIKGMIPYPIGKGASLFPPRSASMRTLTSKQW
jgi:division/cell wall cluster transcriptional repressor MraZ